jgi:hypothetical protein
MAKYLLECECGHKIPVHVSQAGQNVACRCGRQLNVPTLRRLKSLEQVTEPSGSRRAVAGEWGQARGVTFAAAVVLLVVGLGFAGMNYSRLRASQTVLMEDEVEVFAAAIEATSPADLFDAWKEIRTGGLGPHGNDPYVFARKYRSGLQSKIGIGLGIGALGLLMALGTMVLPAQTPTKK